MQPSTPTPHELYLHLLTRLREVGGGLLAQEIEITVARGVVLPDQTNVTVGYSYPDSVPCRCECYVLRCRFSRCFLPMRTANVAGLHLLSWDGRQRSFFPGPEAFPA